VNASCQWTQTMPSTNSTEKSVQKTSQDCVPTCTHTYTTATTQIEPTLLPINENDYERKVNTADNARFDISVRKPWNNCDKTFFDMLRITHPTSQSYSGKSLAEIYQQHEKEKDKYN